MNLSDKLEIVCKTDTGRKRDHNEDAVGKDAEIGLVVLADGMGGYQAGEVASAMAVNVVIEHVREGMTSANTAPSDEIMVQSAHSDLIEEGIRRANQAVHSAAQDNPKFHGMGTTVVVVLIHDNILSIGHVGDSRLYRFRDDHLELITEDHSLVRELVRKGYYTEAEAREATNKNVVTRALGVEAEVEPEVQEELALLDDLYLLCSDGLNDMVEDQEIAKVLRKHAGNLTEVGDALIKLANEMGGKDNISVILVKPVKPFQEKRSLLAKIGNWFTETK